MKPPKRIKIEVEVNLDRVPGWGNRPSDYVEHIQQLLDQTIRHYDPQVVYVGEAKEVKNRVAS
jgi:hypothetical protein